MDPWRWLTVLLAYLLVVTSPVSTRPDDKRPRSDHDEELVFVHAVWRHGLMTQEYDLKHPMLNGLRTPLPEGLVQTFKLGQITRQRYIENQSFLEPRNAYSEIYVRSIDFNRSIEGAAAKLAGMLPIKEPVLEKLRGWPSNWMPMPIHMVPLDQDINLNMGIICPKYEYFEKKEMNLIPAYNKTLEENRDLFDYLSEKLNMTVTRDTIGLVWAAVLPGNVLRSDIPHWVNDTLRERMLKIAQLEEHYKLIKPLMIRIRGGPMITEIYNRMEAKWETMRNESKSSDRTPPDLYRLKYYGYSCRGMPMLWQFAAMGIHNATEDDIPAYASSLVYELWNKSGKPYVSVYYYNGHSSEFKPIQVKLCPEVPARCPLKDFRRSVEPYFVDPEDWWYEDCGVPKPAEPSAQPAPVISEKGSYRSLTIIFAIIIIVLTLFVIIQICILVKPRARPGYQSLAERALLVSRDIK